MVSDHSDHAGSNQDKQGATSNTTSSNTSPSSTVEPDSSKNEQSDSPKKEQIGRPAPLKSSSIVVDNADCNGATATTTSRKEVPKNNSYPRSNSLLLLSPISITDKVESFREVLLEASRSSVLNWWYPACGDTEKSHMKAKADEDALLGLPGIPANSQSTTSDRVESDELSANQVLEKAELTTTLQTVLNGQHQQEHNMSKKRKFSTGDSTEQQQHNMVDSNTTTTARHQEVDAVREIEVPIPLFLVEKELLQKEMELLEKEKENEPQQDTTKDSDTKDTATAKSTATTANNSTTSSFTSDETSNKEGRAAWKNKWEHAVGRIGHAIAIFLTSVACQAARNPYLTIISTFVVTAVVLGAGCYTNFTLVLDNSELWPPRNSFTVDQTNWLYDVSDYHYEYRYIDMLVHANGANVATAEGVSRVFEAMSVIQAMEDYNEGCRWADLLGDAYKVGKCHIHSVTNLWNNSLTVFEEQSLTDEEVILAMSRTKYPSGEPLDVPRVLGNPSWGYEDGQTTVTSANSFLIEFDLPWSYETDVFELTALNELFILQDNWKSQANNPFRLELVAFRSYEDEFFRAIMVDLPLLPAVFGIMSLFCCMVFWRYDRVHSRSLMGIGAVVTIMLSIMTSHGLMFCFGVPFTTSTTMLPFLMFGIGLDDSFVILGSYNRTKGIDIEKRIEETMKDIGLSIGLTTLTSTLAFALGCFSAIPAVRWLCLYACPSVLIDFVYQITFFISLLVLDERRIQDRRLDCFVCVKAREEEDDKENCVEDGATSSVPLPFVNGRHWSDRFMMWYADKLLKPKVQICVLVCFVALLGGSIYATTQLTQDFDLNDMVPQDSYLRSYYSSLKRYAKGRTGLPSYAFFRDLNHSDPAIQDQMIGYVEELATSGAIAESPPNFWLRDFREFVNRTEMTSQSNMTFNDQVEEFLQEPLYYELYNDHIIRDSVTGDIVDSRCEIYIDVDIGDAKGGTEALHNLRQVSSTQPANKDLHGSDWKIFTYQDMYNLWEFYAAVLSELSFSTIIGVVAVSLVGFLLIPHWSAVLFISPMVLCLYVDMLGYISYSNVNVNAISYVQVVMSIGLMVDYIMHILMRYYECKGTRRERVKETLSSMGASVFLGGLSSILGVSLLAFSTSQILRLVFVSVMGLVILGILHGLVFLPVILSLIGPQ